MKKTIKKKQANSYIFYMSGGEVGMCWVGRAEGWTVVRMGAIVARGGSCVRVATCGVKVTGGIAINLWWAHA